MIVNCPIIITLISRYFNDTRDQWPRRSAPRLFANVNRGRHCLYSSQYEVCTELKVTIIIDACSNIRGCFYKPRIFFLRKASIELQ